MRRCVGTRTRDLLSYVMGHAFPKSNEPKSIRCLCSNNLLLTTFTTTTTSVCLATHLFCQKPTDCSSGHAYVSYTVLLSSETLFNRSRRRFCSVLRPDNLITPGANQSLFLRHSHRRWCEPPPVIKGNRSGIVVCVEQCRGGL